MTTWDNIYKDFQKGGVAWATLSEDIDERFKDFISKSDFKHKYAFDIGCGTGKYLKFLQSLGFKTDGIDSSETALQMTKKLLSDNSKIDVADMFEYEIDKNKYDLIFSISTIHHGTKSQVKNLVDQIYSALINDGKFFITLSDLQTAIGGEMLKENLGEEESKKWNTFKDHTEIEPGTYAPNDGPEKGLAHSFYTKEEVEKMFLKFKNVDLELDEIGRWFVIGEK